MNVCHHKKELSVSFSLTHLGVPCVSCFFFGRTNILEDADDAAATDDDGDGDGDGGGDYGNGNGNG